MSVSNQRILITGASGLLGFQLAEYYLSQGWAVYGTQNTSRVEKKGITFFDVDLLHFSEASQVFEKVSPELIIHCAALTNVDECERNPNLAFKVNTYSSEQIARYCAENGIKFVFISTDQLWNGSKTYLTESEDTCPINIYGSSKAKAEEMILKISQDALILRTNFYGFSIFNGKSILDWIMNSLKKGETISGFDDVFFTPISLYHLIRYLDRLLHRKAKGIFHVVGSERLTKYEFAIKVANRFELPLSLIQKSSIREKVLLAKRPLEMSLSCNKIESFLQDNMPDIHSGLEKI